jgi:PAS domain S-box-containing protein
MPDDVSDREQVEKALRRSEERFELFMRHLPGAAFIKDSAGRYVYANLRCEAAQRVGPRGWEGKTDDELFSPDSAAQFRATDQRVFETGRPHESVESAIWDDEVQHWLVQKFPIPDSGGTGPLVGGAAFDITALKRTEEALRDALEERERLARDLHDGIIQDIYAIGLHLEEVLRTTQHDARISPGVEQAISGLNDVIRKVRRQIAGPAPQLRDGQQFRAELQDIARRIDKAHGLRISVAINERAAARLTPEAAYQLLHIAREAISNSLRHSKGKRAKVSLKECKGGIRMVIADDGKGFDLQSARKLGQGLRNMATRATGLAAHLDIRSAPGEGTTITLELPA